MKTLFKINQHLLVPETKVRVVLMRTERLLQGAGTSGKFESLSFESVVSSDDLVNVDYSNSRSCNSFRELISQS